MPLIFDALRSIIRKNSDDSRQAARVRRRRVLSAFLGRYLPHIRSVYKTLYRHLYHLDVFPLIISVILYLVGFLWVFFLPSALLGRGTYIDENALQPSQASILFSSSIRSL